MNRYIDAHIHLDSYEPAARTRMLDELPQYGVEKVIAVSMHLASCEANRELHRQYPGLVKPAYGYHPEQLLPSEAELDRLFDWIRRHREETVAIGEVGLPYYNRQEAEANGKPFRLEPYVEMLEAFVALAAELDKPIVLHAVYEDADIACDLLEKHGVGRAHFHWFKGGKQTIERMIRNGYCVSFTPDIVYEQEIQELAAVYPLAQVMAETDGPWPFEGPFQGQTTHPRMLASVIAQVAAIKGISEAEAARALHGNTRRFYRLTD